MSSDEDERKKRSINEMFGDDSNDEDEEDDIRPASMGATTADASGLFGSDSESDDDEVARKPVKRAASPPTKRAKTSKSKSSSRPKEEVARRQRRDSGDEYDSGDEVVVTKDDEDFIDGDDDLEDVLGEYDQDTQRFDDERPLPDDEHPGAGRGASNDDFFDQTLKSLKTGRARAKLNLSAQEMEQITQEVLYRMDKAYTDDMQAIEQRRPALEKIKFVDSALHVMRKIQLQPMLLDFDVLSFIKKWIQPLDDGTLPNVGVRTKMLEMVNRLPVFKEHLKRSGFGKVVMLLMKHPQETRENKELCRGMVERWSRSVFNKTLDYSKLAELEAEKAENAAYRRRLMKKKAARDSKPQNERSGGGNKVFGARTNEDFDSKPADAGSERALMPDQLKFDFLLRPPPKVELSNNNAQKQEVDTRKARLMKRMQQIAKPGKKGKRAVTVKIAGG